jgi:hypothetical protein
MHYSICFKNDAGHTQRSEFTRFKTDLDAVGYGRKSARETAIVEVWKGNRLLARLRGNDAKTPDAQA